MVRIVTPSQVVAEATAMRLALIKMNDLEGEFIDYLIATLKNDEEASLYDVVREFSEDLELEEV